MAIFKPYKAGEGEADIIVSRKGGKRMTTQERRRGMRYHKEEREQGWNDPKSVCTCGHTGDGPFSQHHSNHEFSLGHGACRVMNCPCAKFTWKGWTREFELYLFATRGEVKA